MSDDDNLDKPDLTSDYQTGVLQNIKNKIKRLWRGDYRGLSGLPVGAKRIKASYDNIKIYENSSTGERLIHDSKTNATDSKIAKMIADSESMMNTSLNSEINKASNYPGNQFIHDLQGAWTFKSNNEIFPQYQQELLRLLFSDDDAPKIVKMPKGERPLPPPGWGVSQIGEKELYTTKPSWEKPIIIDLYKYSPN